MQSKVTHCNTRSWLVSEFAARKRQNAAYSLRAFARHLGLSPSAASEILAGTRPLAPKTAERVVNQLCLSGEQRTELLALAASECRARRKRAPISSALPEYLVLEADRFAVIAEARHYAILGLMKTDDFRSDPKWIAARLNLSLGEVLDALERLERVELIERQPEKGWLRRVARVATSNDFPSSALRQSHRETLEDTITALETVDVQLRDITSVTVALDPQRLNEAKDMLRAMRRHFLETMESGAKTEVFNLNIQLVPVTAIRKENL